MSSIHHFMQNHKITLPGSAGLVGQNLIPHLKEKGYMNKDYPNLIKFLNWMWLLLLFLTLICKLVPFSPDMPGAGGDSSWNFGMNQALAQGLVLGRDLIFTFGPYTSIYTHQYHPFVDHFMLIGGFYLAISYAILFFLLTHNSRWYLKAAFCIALAGFCFSRDALLFLYPVSVGVLIYKWMREKTKVQWHQKKTLLLTIIIFAPFGLLPLIKGSIFIICICMALLVESLFLVNRKCYLAMAVVLAPIFSVSFFWVLSGQAIANLPNFFVAIIPIISGYTEAMAYHGRIVETIAYLIPAIFLLINLYREEKIPQHLKLFIFCVFFIFLFLAFKASFVRHDVHALAAATSILFATLLFSMFSIFRIRLVVLISLSTLCCFFIQHHYASISLMHNINNTYASAWDGLSKRLFKPNELQNEFKQSLQILKNKAKFPLLEGTTDIYSYDQAYLIASGNTWNPRPIFQSYSVYTPSLIEKNRQHLLSAKAPDNLIFKIQPIDNRIPSLEDAASWPVILSHYEPIKFEDDFLYLHKRAIVPAQSNLFPIAEGKYTFDDVVNVPVTDLPVFAEISIKPSLLGKLMNLLFKTPQLQMTFHLDNGTTKTYRMIAEMATSGFMVSPLIESTKEFSFLYNKHYLLDKHVQFFSIHPFYRKLWDNHYEVHFKKMFIPEEANLGDHYKFNRIIEKTDTSSIIINGKCDGSIDDINGISPAPMQFSTSYLLQVRGWLASSVDQGLLAESVYVVLTDSKGKYLFIETNPMLRLDVAHIFKKPTLGMSGYTLITDVSKLLGNYTVSLAFKEGHTIKICSRFKIPVTFSR